MKTEGSRIRLDMLLLARGMAPSREKAKALILSGSVLVEEENICKAGTLVRSDSNVRIKGERSPYASRGGIKLKGAITHFKIDARGLVAMDVGASTGGFTDCLLQEGVRKVYAIDFGYGQIAWKLRSDPRVSLFERTNIRYFSGEGIADTIDIATIDVSFISLTLVLPVVADLVKEGAIILALIKPQFEAGRKEVGKNGVIKDERVHKKVCDEIVAHAESLNLHVMGTCESPINGPAGNREFFLYAEKSDRVPEIHLE
jgi:23S rRNA (cytidine1920-2'-O)/16S rRNA (cytidine1409-2'-O)-methyltransferase